MCCRHTLLNYLTFGSVIIDRFAMYAGRTFRFKNDDVNLFETYCRQDTGLVLFSSHTGNYEAAGYHMHSSKTYYALVYGGEAQVVMEQRNRMFADNNVVMVPVSDDMSHLFTLNAALQEGNIVSLPADRPFGSGRTITSRMFNTDVQLPLGPFALAARCDVPVLFTYVMKERWNTYRILFRQPKPINTLLSHQDKLQQLADSFCRHTEDIIRHYPHQWFNYYDFFNDRHVRPDRPPNLKASLRHPSDITPPLPASPLLPQGHEFQFVDTLCSYTPEAVSTSFHITADCPYTDEHGIADSMLLIEHIAQSSAVRIGYIQHYLLHRPISIGYVGAVRGLTIHRLPHIGETLTTTIRVVSEAFSLTAIEARVCVGREILATARIKTALHDTPN